MRILVFGAGVVGQVYGARLAEAGHDVTLLARGETLARLSSRGVSLDAGRGELLHARPAVVAEPPHGESYDLLLATVRRDQLEGALPLLAELPAERAALMLNCPLGLESAGASLGTGRTLFAFPGIGGYRSEDGTIRYIEVPQQKTTVGGDGGDEQILVDLLRSAGFPVDLTDEVEGWLKTHAAFIAALGAAILEAGGDSAVLAADPARLRTMVTAVGEGFRALARNGVAVTPTPLRLLFTRLPRFVAARYWRGQLRGPVGTVAIAPHVRASRDTELPLLCSDVRRLVAGGGRTPHLTRLLDTVDAQV